MIELYYKIEGLDSVEFNEDISLEYDDLYLEINKELSMLIVKSKKLNSENVLEEIIARIITYKEFKEITIPKLTLDEKKSITGNKIDIRDRVTIRDVINSFKSSIGPEDFKKHMNKMNLIQSNYYKRLYYILKNKDITTKYLMLYEFLLEIVSLNKKNREQKNVKDFITTKNLHEGINSIGMKKTRRKNKNFEEDSLTYLRNEISHAELDEDYEQYENISKKITSYYVRKIIEVIDLAIKDIGGNITIGGE